MVIRELNAEGRKQLKMIDLEHKEPARIIAKFSRLDVDTVQWVDDDWLLFTTFDENDRSGKTFAAGLAAVKRDGSRIRELIKRRFETAFPQGGSQPLEPNHYFIGMGAPGTNEIVLAEAHYNTEYTEVTHTTPRIMNVATGAVRSMFKDRAAPPMKVKSWVIDRLGQPRIAYSRTGADMTVFWADGKTGEWRKLAQFASLHASFIPEYVDEKDQLFVSLIDPKTNLAQIHKFDFAKGEPEKNALLALPGFDADDVTPIRDPGSNKVHGLRVLTDATSVAWFSPTMAAIQKQVDEMLPGRVNLLTCHPCAQPKTVLIHSYSDTTPGDYLLYKPAEGKFERVAEVRPGHRADLMANVELHRSKTRDGADLPVWITKTEAGPAGRRPAVVLVHGGPWVRGGEWGWDSEAQFLATRGYVVIEPEFRGSTGFGDAHYRAGWKQWGQLMQDDVADALRFAVDKGWVDPSKVCIAGASYGGYATLMGLARHKDLYKCGVAWVAVTDPRLMYTVHWSDISDDAKTHSMPQMIGDLEKDAAMLKANAPVELASKIKAPLLLAYGAKDRRVPLVHGEQMRDALASAGAKPEWIVYDDEGHGWDRTVNQVNFWTRVEAFLKEHLK
jgi:acetyl esterase/lipase